MFCLSVGQLPRLLCCSVYVRVGLFSLVSHNNDYRGQINLGLGLQRADALCSYTIVWYFAYAHPGGKAKKRSDSCRCASATTRPAAMVSLALSRAFARFSLIFVVSISFTLALTWICVYIYTYVHSYIHSYIHRHGHWHYIDIDIDVEMDLSIYLDSATCKYEQRHGRTHKYTYR